MSRSETPRRNGWRKKRCPGLRKKTRERPEASLSAALVVRDEGNGKVTWFFEIENKVVFVVSTCKSIVQVTDVSIKGFR